MSNVAIDLTKTVKEIITTMKTAIDNLNSDVATNKTAIDNLNTDVSSNKTAIDNLKEQILQAVYPVGFVYVSITDSRNPADILGFGTWEALPAGYGLVAQGTATAEDGSTLTFTAGSKSGEFKHRLTVGELAKHKHLTVWGEIGTFPWGDDNDHTHKGNGSTTDSDNPYPYSEPVGNDEYHNNVSACIAVYLWKRTS